VPYRRSERLTTSSCPTGIPKGLESNSVQSL